MMYFPKPILNGQERMILRPIFEYLLIVSVLLELSADQTKKKHTRTTEEYTRNKDVWGVNQNIPEAG